MSERMRRKRGGPRARYTPEEQCVAVTVNDPWERDIDRMVEPSHAPAPREGAELCFDIDAPRPWRPTSGGFHSDADLRHMTRSGAPLPAWMSDPSLLPKRPPTRLS